jgi:hypothetical protein
VEVATCLYTRYSFPIFSHVWYSCHYQC